MAAKYNVKLQYAAWIAVVTLGTVVVMTVVHFYREVSAREDATRARAELTAAGVARAVASAMASNNVSALPALVAGSVNDDEVLYLRILKRDGAVVYRPWRDREPQGVLLVNVPVVTGGTAGTNQFGTVQLGIAKTAMTRGLMQTVLMDLAVGALLVTVFVGASFFVSAPVSNALQELQRFVKRVAAGESRGEQLDSDLSEVDEVSKELNALVARVEDARARLDRAQKELKAAQKEMDEYTYVISHDLKEPLRGIEAFSKFLADGYRAKLDEDGRHHIDVIRQSALRMQRLISDLLKFSRLSQQKNPLSAVGLNSMLMHVRVNLQYALDAKKVDLRVDKLPTVVCDATAMTEVFHNLISNAVKYNDKPRPVVEVGYTERTNPQTKQGEYEFFVRDNGQGIKKEYFEKIFQLFQRLQRDEEGTGIGLTIVKRVVEWHGGRIWLESEEGKGTTFYFTLPKRETSKTGTIVDLPPEDSPKGGARLAPAV